VAQTFRAGTTTRKAGATREDPLSDVKRQYESAVERKLMTVWRDFSRELIQQLRGHLEAQAKGLVGDVLKWELWGQLSRATMKVLLPSIEEMMHDAVGHALETMPMDVGVDRDAVHTEVAEWAREHAGDLVDGIDETTKKRVRIELANWIEAGEELPKLENRMRDIFEAQWRAKMIAVTETTRAFAYAKEKLWSESRVIHRKRWNTVNDKYVCDICEPLHGTVRKLGATFPGGYRNPGDTHPRCRCFLTPVPD